MSRKVQWATLVAKRAKLQSKVASLGDTEAELKALEDQMAAEITPEAIIEAKERRAKLLSDLERAEETLIGKVTEARNAGNEVDEESSDIVDELLASEREAADEGTTVELETEPEVETTE